MASRLGVVIVGVNGAVASTLIAGVELMARGLVPRIGMVTEAAPGDGGADTLTSLLDVTPIEGLVFGGWDVRFANVYEGALHHKVLARDLLSEVKAKLEAIRPWPGVFHKKYAENVAGDHTVAASSHSEEIEIVRRNIEDFKKANKVDRVVMVNLASTETTSSPRRSTRASPRSRQGSTEATRRFAGDALLLRRRIDGRALLQLHAELHEHSRVGRARRQDADALRRHGRQDGPDAAQDRARRR